MILGRIFAIIGPLFLGGLFLLLAVFEKNFYLIFALSGSWTLLSLFGLLKTSGQVKTLRAYVFYLLMGLLLSAGYLFFFIFLEHQLIKGLAGLLAVFALFYYSLQTTNNIDYARTMAFVGLGLTSLFYVFSVKTLRLAVWRINPFSNNALNMGVLIGLGLYAVAIYLEFFRNILGTVALGLNDWYILAALGLFNIVVIELGKFVFLNGKEKRKSLNA